MPTVTERERGKAKENRKSMGKENEKDFLPRKELPFSFEKELLQKQVKNTPVVIKEFIPVNDSDNCKVIVFFFTSFFFCFLQESGPFVGWFVGRLGCLFVNVAVASMR